MKRWYAVYTKSRAEKLVLERLKMQEVEAYLPLQKRLKYWSDRKKWVEEPLIRSYVFVHINPNKEYFKVLNTDGVVAFVKFEHKLAAIPEEQINALKELISSGLRYEVTNDHYSLGDYVQIIHGEMKGYTGYLIAHRGKYNVVMHIENINQNIMLHIPAEFLCKIRSATAFRRKTGMG